MQRSKARNQKRRYPKTYHQNNLLISTTIKPQGDISRYYAENKDELLENY